MKRLFKFRLPKQQSAAVGAGAGLFLLSALLILFGIFYAGREVLMVGLIGALPALVQLILLLPRLKTPVPPEQDPELLLVQDPEQDPELLLVPEMAPHLAVR